MVTKVLTVKPWKVVVGEAKVDDKGLQQALTKYKGLDKKKRVDRLKAITSISRLVVELKRDTKVVAIPSASKYLNEVAAVLESDRVEIKKADAEATIDVTISNSSSYDDIFLTVEDLNLARNRMILDRERLNKKQSLAITLAASGSGKGQIHWIAVLTEDAASRKEDTVKDIKDGQTIKVSG